MGDITLEFDLCSCIDNGGRSVLVRHKDNEHSLSLLGLLKRSLVEIRELKTELSLLRSCKPPF